MNESPLLWRFFGEYWDDHIVFGGSDRVVINARTIRVLEKLFGRDALKRQLKQWEEEGDIRILASFTETSPDESCVEILGYVGKPLPDS